MLDAHELKVVLSTLTQRRAWLLKALDKNDIDAKQREEHIVTLKALDGSMQKLARMKAPTKSPSPSSPAAPKKKKRIIEPAEAHVLIAEDDASSAELLRGVLEDIGIKHIEVVEDGRAALYALQNCSPPYDIVLCDWEMPEMNGLEVRKAVKSLAKLRDTYYVMVTGMTDVARIREAVALGISDYIAKPVDIDILEKKIRNALGEGEKSGETPPPEEKSA